MTKTTPNIAAIDIIQLPTPISKANFEDQLNFKALGAIPKIKSLDNISDPKLELKQPKIEGYFRKSAEINVKTKPILPDIEALDYSENIVDIDHKTNICNIDDNLDKYPDEILGLSDQNIAQNSDQDRPNPSGSKLKWTRFSDIKYMKSLVRLPNPTTVKVQSDMEPKKNEGRKRVRRRKKEEMRAENCKNPISNYFPRIEVGNGQCGKRKLEVTNIDENTSSKKSRVGSSD